MPNEAAPSLRSFRFRRCAESFSRNVTQAGVPGDDVDRPFPAGLTQPRAPHPHHPFFGLTPPDHAVPSEAQIFGLKLQVKPNPPLQDRQGTPQTKTSATKRDASSFDS